jgi:hypothetical protein
VFDRLRKAPARLDQLVIDRHVLQAKQHLAGVLPLDALVGVGVAPCSHARATGSARVTSAPRQRPAACSSPRARRTVFQPGRHDLAARGLADGYRRLADIVPRRHDHVHPNPVEQLLVAPGVVRRRDDVALGPRAVAEGFDRVLDLDHVVRVEAALETAGQRAQRCVEQGAPRHRDGEHILLAPPVRADRDGHDAHLPHGARPAARFVCVARHLPN